MLRACRSLGGGLLARASFNGFHHYSNHLCLVVVRQNDIAGERLKNQRHADRHSLVRSTGRRGMYIVTRRLAARLKGRTEFSVGTVGDFFFDGICSPAPEVEIHSTPSRCVSEAMVLR
jgi:hypothetical protein